MLNYKSFHKKNLFMNTLIFAEGNGFGHVSRDIVISKELGIPIMTYGMGAEYLKMRNHEFIEIPSPYKIENKGRTKILADIEGITKFFNPKISAHIVKKFKEVDFVIVDGSPLGLILASIAGKKSVLIANDLSSLVGFHGIQRPIAKELNDLILAYPEQILVPDFPPPFTVTKYNLKDSDHIKKIRMIGCLIEKTKQIKHNCDYVVITTNLKLNEKIKSILGKKAIYSNEVGNVKQYYKNCKLVICHGGHTTITESLSYGKPVLVIYDDTYSERLNHVRFLEEMNVGVGIEEKLFREEYLNVLPEIIEYMDEEKLEIYSKLYTKFDPINEIKRTINEII